MLPASQVRSVARPYRGLLGGVATAVGLCWLAYASRLTAAEPSLILHHGKIVTVDRAFSIAEAVAIEGNRIVAVGSNEAILPLAGPATERIHLQGKTVLPGLSDSHVHPESACLTEFDHAIPTLESIDDVLGYIRARAEALGPGKWIEVHQVFITRLREQRYPTRAELDQAAPQNPVLFATGPDASVNTLALERSGINRSFQVTDGGPGRVEKDPASGEPTGILRSCTRFIKVEPSGKQPTESDHYARTAQLLRDYASVGITSIGDRDASEAAIERYRRLRANGDLNIRVSVSQHVDTIGPIEGVLQKIAQIGRDPLCKPDPRLRIIGIKTYLDGGMLTGSAYMRQPWGLSAMYAITDPEYRGLLFISSDRLSAMVRAAVEAQLQFTAHSVGDGAVHALLDAYQEVNETRPIRATRPCITHSNFMSREAVALLVQLGVLVDIQPAWLYLDTRTLQKQFGYDRLRYFQPLRTIFEAGGIAGGGSDHMQKIGSLRSINPYNPFLGMWVTLTRRARWYDGVLHPEEALTREQAIRFYTINNAFILFREDQTGSIEPGKLADFALLDRDILSVPVDDIKETQVLATYCDGRPIYSQLGKAAP
ncbi:MAG: amidohydrolase [Verrucomicrobiota bacterium]